MRGQPLSPVLVGRDDLAALAARRLAAVREGTGHLLFLAGEAGIGKSRLLAEACGRAADQGVRVVGVAAYPRDAEVAGGLLGDLAGALDDEAFAARLRVQPASDGAGDASRQRRLLVTDLAGFVLAAAAGGPIVIALEDLHWADELTLEVLDRVAGRLRTVPMLLVGTYRSDELFPRVPMRALRARLLTQRLAEEARLGRLDLAGTAAMVRAITGDAAPAEVIATVHERSDGIPLHVEEFLANLTGPDTSRTVPDTLADAVLTRAHDLSPVALSLAGAASVIGRSFDLDLLTAITDLSPAEVDDGLAELRDRFFVRPRGEATYDFRHALIRDALYADLAPLRRRDLHGRVAALASEPASVSDHYERAHRPALAYRFALVAAAQAVSLSAHREAVQLYRRAQRTTPTAIPSAERAALLVDLAGELAAIDDNNAAAAAYASAHALRVDLGDIEGAASVVPAWVAVRHLLGATLDERTAALRDALSSATARSARTGILAGLAAAYLMDDRLDEAILYGQEARVLATDPAADSASSADDWATRLDIDATLGSVLVFAGRMSEGWPLLEWSIGAARESDLEAQTARGYRMIGSSASALVEYDRAEHWLREGIAHAERTERFNDRHYMTAHLAHVLWAVGDWPAAEREARRALADGQGGVTTRIEALHVLGYLAVGQGSSDDAFLTEARELGERMGELQRLSPALWGLAEHALHSGRPADAAAWCERGYAASAAVGDAAYLFPFLITGVRAYLALDDRGAARDWAGRCSVLLRRRGIPGTLPALDHAQGLLHLSDGQTGRARDALAAAGEGWDRLRRFWEGTAALLDRASAAERSRRPAEAGTLRTEAHARASAAGATALYVGLPAATSEGPLSPRELEVARLVATGATNRRIAEILTISPKTVAAHVEHILTKLGADRRAEIAAWVTAHIADR